MPRPYRRPPARHVSARLAAGAAVALVALAGVALGHTPDDAHAADACLVSPMAPATPVGSDAGFTIWTSGDAHLRNQELEGSIAVGGTLRVSGSGQYPVVHKIAGDGDYAVPLVDGARTRMFLDEYLFADGDTRVQLKTEGATDASHLGGLKIATVGAGYTFGAGEASAVAYHRGTAPNDGIVVLDTPFTTTAAAAAAMTAVNPWTSYFPTTTAEATAVLDGATYAAPTVHGTSGEAGVELVAGPNRVAFDEIAGITKMRLEGDATAALYVKVAQTDVVAGVLTVPSLVTKPDAARVLWDLSDVTGAVRITAGEPVRGAIFAPAVDLVVTDKEVEGQIIARSFDDSAGNEIHTYLFGGVLACVTSPSTPTPTATPTSGVTPTATPTETPTSTATPSAGPGTPSGTPGTDPADGPGTDDGPTATATAPTGDGDPSTDAGSGDDAAGGAGIGAGSGGADSGAADSGAADSGAAGGGAAGGAGSGGQLATTGTEVLVAGALAALLATGGLVALAVRRRQVV